MALDQGTDRRLLVGIEEAAIPGLGPARAGLQAGHPAFGDALADIEDPGPGQPNLRGNGIVSETGLAQADDLPPTFLLGRGRQLAHGHMVHAADLAVILLAF